MNLIFCARLDERYSFFLFSLLSNILQFPLAISVVKDVVTTVDSSPTFNKVADRAEGKWASMGVGVRKKMHWFPVGDSSHCNKE